MHPKGRDESFQRQKQKVPFGSGTREESPEKDGSARKSTASSGPPLCCRKRDKEGNDPPVNCDPHPHLPIPG